MRWYNLGAGTGPVALFMSSGGGAREAPCPFWWFMSLELLMLAPAKCWARDEAVGYKTEWAGAGYGVSGEVNGGKN